LLRRAAHVALVVVAACGDDRAPPVDAAIDAAIDAPLLPDLALVAAQMDGTTVVTDTMFAPDACELVEGCIGAAGLRRLLRFATVTENRGPGDLDLGPVPPPGVSAGIFVWSPCHMHHHVAGYASYELRDASSGVVMGGHKQAFCLEDDEQVEPLGPTHGYHCNVQGISPGWADVYGNGLPCQWLDITDVAPGTYTLHVAIDGTGVLPDADPTNNEWSTSVAF
jgi:hypothetical protein